VSLQDLAGLNDLLHHFDDIDDIFQVVMDEGWSDILPSMSRFSKPKFFARNCVFLRYLSRFSFVCVEWCSVVAVK